MTDIPNTEYITINKDWVFVGGKPAIKYRGVEIFGIDLVQHYFVDILKLNPHVTELHVLSSETRGKWAVAGNPSGKHGLNEWCRVKFNNGYIGSWVFFGTSSSVTYCALFCASRCMYAVCTYADLRSAVFGAVIDKQNVKPVTQPEAELKQKLQDTDLSQFVGKPVQLNGYEIIVRKLAETKQIKR